MNVKPGDLAIVIQSRAPDALGKVCEVIRHAGERRLDKFGPSPCWWIRFPVPVVDVYGNPELEVLCPDFALLPVSGLPDTEDTNTEQPICEGVK